PARAAAPSRPAPARPQLVAREDTARIVVPQVPRMATSTIPRAPRAELDTSAPAVATGLDERSSPAAAPRGAPVDPMVVRAEAMTLVRAVFDYRWLRLQQLRGEMLDHVELARMDELENHLQHGLSATATDGGHRRYRRFGCAVPGWIARFDGRRIGTVPIALEDISAGGAQVRMTDTLPTAENCWLVVDLENEADDPVVVFGARVVWSLPGDHRLGLVFSGSVRSGIDGMELVRADAGL
ncbi:MAG: PilZ domain-containing protein, partial [Nannocystaceae bacterium]|nr:PilZ domain-containing protein [Nannocystaceae bacterium]